jgi:DNA repair and recombination protein RAD52
MTFNPEQIKAMQAPLNSAAVKSREQGGRQVSYIEGWHAIAEANRIFGFDGWNRETVLLQETNRDLVTLKGRNDSTYEQWRIGYIAKVRITVGGIVREGTGYGSGMGKPEAVGDAVEGAIKEAETDAMKRALMTFGNPFGLALYDKTQANVVDEEQVRQAEAALQAHLAAFQAANALEPLQGAFAKAWKAIGDEDGRTRLKAAYESRKAALTPAEDEFPGGEETNSQKAA